jgi:hypothetical protein
VPGDGLLVRHHFSLGDTIVGEDNTISIAHLHTDSVGILRLGLPPGGPEVDLVYEALDLDLGTGD